MGTDLDIPADVEVLSEIQDDLSEHFKPTECSVSVHDEEVRVNLSYRGFDSYESAHGKVADHASRLNDLADEVRMSIDTAGAYDPEAEEHDDRPAGTVTAVFETLEE